MKPYTLRRPGREKELLVAFKAGDLQAYACLMRKHQDFVNRTALTFTKDKTKAIEVAIRAFMKLWSERENIPDNASLMAYLRKFVGEIALPDED